MLIADLGNRLVKEKLEHGSVHFQIGDVFGRAVEGCMKEGGAQGVIESE